MYGNKNLILLKYNNYYNRTLKYYATAAEYVDYQIGNTILNVNFNPNDGVSTTIDIDWYDDIPDYLLVVNPDAESTINSRWYVIDSKRLRSGQFRLSLFRDLLADYYEEVNAAPVFVEKGILRDGNTLIYNSENMSYSQVKTNETLLKDKSQSAWLVGYCDSSSNLEKQDGSRVYYASSNYANRTDIITVTDSTQWTYYKNSSLAENPETLPKVVKGYYCTGFIVNDIFLVGSNFGAEIIAKDGRETNSLVNDYPYTENRNQLGTYPADVGTDDPGYYFDVYNPFDMGEPATFGNAFLQSSFSKNSFELVNVIKQNYGLTDPTTMAINGKILYFSDLNRAYKVEISPYGRKTRFYDVAKGTSLFTEMSTICALNYEISKAKGEPNNNTFHMAAACEEYIINMTPVAIETTRLDMASADKRLHLTDAPYDMFAIPFSPIQIQSTYQGTTTTHVQQVNTDAVFACVQELARIQGIGNNKPIYDIQLLPFCPFPELIVSPGVVKLPGIDSGTDYGKTYTNIDAGVLSPEGVWTTSSRVGVVFYCSSSSFTNQITEKDPTVLTNKKLRSETELYRLVSPNYNGVFEWNQVKNGGFEQNNITFNISCSYKPFTPFIQISPAFGGLYGQTYEKDNRGCICGGDFSMPIINDTWSAYQQQNRNYQAIFDRQIENMEVQNNYQRVQQQFGMVTGTAQGALSGAMTGALAGPYGAIAGGVVGGVASGVGGVIDYQMSERLRAEQMDFTKDMFGYQLGNIRALPNGLAKISAFNINNKIFPALEYYVATAEELQAITSKIKYDGMTVMSIYDNALAEFASYKPEDYTITINDMIDSNNIRTWKKVFFRGQLVRLDSIHDDYHVVKSISDELNKGVYI